MRKRFLIVRNHGAGLLVRRRFEAVVDALGAAGARVEIVVTHHFGEGKVQAQDAAGGHAFDAVVAAGGDGTIHDVARGLAGSDMPLGIIPMGTGNVFAREIRMGFSPSAIAQALLSGPERSIALGSANGNPFLFVVGVGFDATAVRHFEASGLRPFGRAGFVLPGLRAMFDPTDGPFLVRTEDGTDEADWVLVARGCHYAGSLTLVPGADLREDQLYLIRLSGVDPLNLGRHLLAMALGRLDRDVKATVEAVERVRIEGAMQAPVEIDGELTGTLPLDIALDRRRLSVIFPT